MDDDCTACHALGAEVCTTSAQRLYALAGTVPSQVDRRRDDGQGEVEAPLSHGMRYGGA